MPLVFDAETPLAYSTQQLIQTDTLQIVPEPVNPLLRCFIVISSGGADGDSEEEDGARAQAGPGPCAGGQKHEVGYESKKTGRSASAVKKAVKKVGNSRKRVEKRLGR